MKQLTIVIPNRNRNLLTVEKSISSIYEQLNEQLFYALLKGSCGISHVV